MRRWQSRSTRPDHRKAIGENATAFPRLPRRFAPRNDTSGSAVVYQRPPTVELPCTGRSLRSRWRLCRLTDAACPLRVMSALQGGNTYGTNSLAQCHQVCHCEGALRRWQSRSTRPDHRKAIGENATAFPRLPRRFAPRNDTSGSAVVHQRPPTVELPCTGRSLSAATVKFDSDCVRRHSVYIGSAFPRLHPKGTSSRFALRAPRPLWGLAMTRPEAFRILHFSVFRIPSFPCRSPTTHD